MGVLGRAGGEPWESGLENRGMGKIRSQHTCFSDSNGLWISEVQSAWWELGPGIKQ